MALFGFPSSKPQAAAPTAPPSGFIYDVTTQSFEAAVMKASMDKPVLVDFWAPWCGPCKQLMPVLEGEVNAAKGEIILAKVNIDENPDLAQALRIQSVPTVLAFFQGQPVTGFTGARPASEIKNLITQLVKLSKSTRPNALDATAVLKEAADLLSSGDIMGAQQLYIALLQQDENNGEAYAGLIRTMIEGGALDQAQGMIDNAPDGIAKSPALAACKTALDLALGAGESRKKLMPLQKAVDSNPNDHQARFDLAGALFAAGDKAGAIDHLLMIVAKDRGWQEEAARKELLRFFEALGFADPLAVEGRKKLSRLLFS
jgi:putative thioredoxin